MGDKSALYANQTTTVWRRFSVQAPADVGAGAGTSETRSPPRDQSARVVVGENRGEHHSHTAPLWPEALSDVRMRSH